MIYKLSSLTWELLLTDGVVLIDPEYFEKEGKQDRKGVNLHSGDF